MLPWGFAGLRIRAAQLRLDADEWLPHELEEGGSTGPEPAQLLCRALRLAPASYQWFELAAVKPGAVDAIGKDVHALGGRMGVRQQDCQLCQRRRARRCTAALCGCGGRRGVRFTR